MLFICGAFDLRGATDAELNQINFEQNLSASLPKDLPFVDENGTPVALKDCFEKKPVILVLGYYECPMLCSMTLNGLVEGLADVKWSIGKEFEIVNVSINPSETPGLALAKKQRYISRYDRPGADEGWHFLTGPESSIQRIASVVGFHYLYDVKSGQYAHPSGIVFLTPAGKISGYLMGVSFSPHDLISALQKASKSEVGSRVPEWVLLCFHYNPFTGKYSGVIMTSVRILAVLTMVGLVGIIGFHRSRTAPGRLLARDLERREKPENP